MNILTEFGYDLGECLSAIESRLGLSDLEDWVAVKAEFVIARSHAEAAGYHLPLLRQSMVTSDPDLLSEVRRCFLQLTMVADALHTLHLPTIEHEGPVGRVISETALRRMLGGTDPPDYTIEVFGEDDQLRDDDDSVQWYQQILERFVPDEDFWWVAPVSDILEVSKDIDELCYQLGLFCYVLRPRPMCLLEFVPHSTLRRPTCLDAKGYPGFWPSGASWGRAVNVSTHGDGAREAIHKNQSAVGRNRLTLYSAPSAKDPRWKDYCESRARIVFLENRRPEE